jgi:tetratricopeptide (TPR) repeat protein
MAPAIIDPALIGAAYCRDPGADEMTSMRATSAACLMLCSAVLGAGADATAQTPPSSGGTEVAPTSDVEVLRARTLARLGRYDEALPLFEQLLAARPTDPTLRAYYAEALIDAGRMNEADAVIDRYLADDPRSVALRRLRARLDVERGAPERAVTTLEGLHRELPDEPGLAGDLAYAEARAGYYRRALGRYDEAIARDPGDPALRAARADLAFAEAPRFEVLHRSLLQTNAESHVEEVAWRGWVADQWWVRPALRWGHYHVDRAPGADGSTDDVQTVAMLVGWQPLPNWSARVGLEEARHDDFYRTTLRLGGGYDDRRATHVDIDVAIRELLTNPVAAVALDGATDRVTVLGWQRIIERVAVAGHYEYRRYRVRGDDLGGQWEADVRAELGLLQRPTVRLTLVPQLFASEYDAEGPRDMRERLGFLSRQEIIATGLLFGWDPLPSLRVAAAGVGRRDVHRDVTSYEFSGDARWRIGTRVELEGLYVRNSDSQRIGGTEETFFARLNFLY